VIHARITKITQQHVQWYLIGVADAPEGAADFIAKVQKMETDSSLMEWMMILVRNSSGSSSIKHNTAGIIKEKGRK
jgi:hypothetical protein